MSEAAANLSRAVMHRSADEILDEYARGQRDFSETTIEGSLARVHLVGAVFRGARMAGVRFDRATLIDVDFSDANLTEADFSLVEGQNLNFTKTELRRATFGSATLTESRFLQADVTGADFTNANLADAMFADDDEAHDARGLLASQLAGALLGGAALPAAISKFEALENVAEASKNINTVFLSLIAACLYSLITVATTTDFGLLTNSATSTLPIITASFPIVGFYYIAPCILLCLFAYLHLHLQRLWDRCADLPACFPDGLLLHQKVYPSLLSVMPCLAMRRLREHRPLLFWPQVVIVLAVFWCAVPVTLLVCWLRVLPRHDSLVMNYLLLACLAAAAAALLSLRTLDATFRRLRGRAAWRVIATSRMTAAGATVVLLYAGILFTVRDMAFFHERPAGLLSSYVIVPEKEEPSSRSVTERRRDRLTRQLVASLVDQIYVPAATGDEAGSVQPRGADFSNRNLRYARAWRATFPNANFTNVDATGSEWNEARLQGAVAGYGWFCSGDLDFVDFTKADLHGAHFQPDPWQPITVPTSLAWARFTQCKCGGAHFTRARLEDAVFDEATLRNADFSRASLSRASFDGVSASGAIFYRAIMDRTRFRTASLMEANFRRAVLRDADFSALYDAETKLSRSTWLRGASFRDADLSGARFVGATLDGVDFECADLRGADFTKALGLTKAQVADAIVDASTLLPWNEKAASDDW